jgi:hypothetical protein
MISEKAIAASYDLARTYSGERSDLRLSWEEIERYDPELAALLRAFATEIWREAMRLNQAGNQASRQGAKAADPERFPSHTPHQVPPPQEVDDVDSDPESTFAEDVLNQARPNDSEWK